MDEDEARRILGVVDHDSPERVRSAYREMLKTWHPDRFVDDPARSADAVRHTRDIVAAYRLITEIPISGVTTPERPPPEPLEEPFWNQWNPFHPSHDRYGPNTAWDRVAIAAVIIIGLVLLAVLTPIMTKQ